MSSLSLLGESLASGRINLDEPRWDQSSYLGRAKLFFTITNPLNIFATAKDLDWAKDVVSKHKNGHILGISDDEIWRAKHLYDSAFHPDTGERMFILGRMSAQVPMNMGITGCMLTFYKTTPQVVFWQWFNQSFNAMVNYTNRSGDTPISMGTLGTSYVAATGGALATALGLNALVKSLPPLVGRLVPFAAVSAANCVNIPMMRRLELQNGVAVFTAEGERLGESKVAARQGIAMVTFSRIVMAAPGMVLIPLFMDRLEKRGFLAKYPRISAPLQIGLCGVILTLATPLCCAIFQQKASIHVDSLEEHLAEKARKMPNAPAYFYYNKGL